MAKVIETQMSSDDELPDEVTFDASRQAALKTAKEARASAKREKTLRKEQRRKRQQLFQEQKRSKRLPEALLRELKDFSKKQPEVTNNKEDEEKIDDSLENNVSSSLPENCSVMRLKDQSASQLLQKNAMDFMQSRLYGRGTRRTSNEELLSLKMKRGESKDASLKFANKKLAPDMRARIERTNKKFQHKKNLILS